MEHRKQERKRLKKACKRAKRRYVAGWKTMGILTLVAAILFTLLCPVVKALDNGIAAAVGGTFWELVDGDENAVFFPMDFYSDGEMAAYGQQICKQVEAEGAVLLLNEGNALPLAEDAKVSCFGQDKGLQDALNKAGLQVGEDGDVAIALLHQVEGEERELLQALSQKKVAGEIQKIVVLIGSENAFDATFLKGNPYTLDGVLWIGNTGISGMDAVAEILAGKVSPSGSLAETLRYNGEKISADGVLYEGIYVGYKYYETRYEDFVMGTGNAGDYGYSQEVAYPFGYGLRYTTFKFGKMAVTYNEKTDAFEVSVTVTNSGKTAGKEIVQVYSQAPYTDYDQENGVEKAAVNLVGFAKTGILQPGESETVTVYVDKRELAAFDTYGKGTYILDEGTYYLTVAKDAHKAVNNILAAKGYTPKSTDGRMDKAGNKALVYRWKQAAFDGETYAVSQNGTAITNQLSAADPNLVSGEKVVWLSRQDWAGTWPETRMDLTAALQGTQYNPADYPTVEMPTLGAQNGLRLYDVIGLAFDDPKWQKLLDQLTFFEMLALIGDTYHWRMPVESVQAPGARDGNGVQDLIPPEVGVIDDQPEFARFPSGNVMAATFNTELMYEAGKVLGNNALASQVVCLYGPDINGSEDSFLAGQICAAQVAAIQDKGVNVAIRSLGSGKAVWLNEQAAREQYLRAYRYVFETGSAVGIAVGDTRLGESWAGGMQGLMSGIFRQEWGSRGMFLAHEGALEKVSAVDGVMAGTTSYNALLPYAMLELYQYRNDPVVVSAMRQACHYNLYALANSAGMNGVGFNTTVKALEIRPVRLCGIAALVCWALYIFFAAMWSRGKKKWRKSRPYLNYRTLKNTLKAQKRK